MFYSKHFWPILRKKYNSFFKKSHRLHERFYPIIIRRVYLVKKKMEDGWILLYCRAATLLSKKASLITPEERSKRIPFITNLSLVSKTCVASFLSASTSMTKIQLLGIKIFGFVPSPSKLSKACMYATVAKPPLWFLLLDESFYGRWWFKGRSCFC